MTESPRTLLAANAKAAKVFDLLAGKDWPWIVALLSILCVLFPRTFFLAPSPFLVNVALTVMIYMILAVGLNVVIGYTGLLDLGYASFIAIGAFVVSLGLVLTNQAPEAFPELEIRKVRLSQEQRQLEPKPGGEIIVQERPDLSYDVIHGAEAVLAAKAAGARTVSARHVDGLVLPVGQLTAKGSHPLHFPGGFFLLLLLAGAVCAVAGVARGFPTLRLTGDYYAIVTLGFAEIVWLITVNEEWLTGGAFGIKLSKDFRPEIFGERLYDDTWQYYGIVWVVLLLSILLAARLQNSRLGRAWSAIKADETAAISSGINVNKVKMLAFAASGFIGGVGGGLWAIKLGTVTARQFDIWQSILVVCCLVLGGMGTIRGALLGAAILMGLGELLRVLADPSQVVTAAGMTLRVVVYGSLAIRALLSWSKGTLDAKRSGAIFAGAVVACEGVLLLLDYSFDPSKLGDALALPAEARFLVYGLILVLLMRFRPQGLLPPRASSEPPTDAELDAIRSAKSSLYTLGEAKP